MIGFRGKRTEFNSAAVLTPAARTVVRVLKRIGAFVRTKARDLVKKSRKTSAPGEPPKGKTNRLRGAILFDADGRSVVIGPALTARKSNDGEPVGTTIPAVLEEGGQIRIVEEFVNGKWVRSKSGRNTGRKTRVRTVRIAPRPFMGPALAKEAPKLPGLWRDSIRKG